MKRHVKELELRLGALTLRERMLVLAVGLGLVFLVWDSLFLRPANLRGDAHTSAFETIQTQLSTLRDTEARVRSVLGDDPHTAARTREATLGSELTELNGRIHAELSELVAPEEMPELLEELLVNLPAVRVLRLEVLDAVPLIEASATSVASLYAHGMRVEVEASYADAVAFLTEIEALPWSIFWDELHYEVVEYPRARVSVVVHTLGAREGWLGV